MQSPGSGQQWPKGTGGPDSERGHIKQENSHHTLKGWGKGMEGQCTERDLGKAPQDSRHHLSQSSVLPPL